MADKKISALSNLASPASGDLIPIVDIDVADSLKNKSITWSQISALTANSANWNSAYDNMIVSASFGTGTGTITLTQQDAGTVTVNIDGRYSLSTHNHDSDYISIVSTPTTGNFPQLTAGGELVNSAYDETSFQAAGTYNTIIGTDTDINYTGATVLATMTLTDGVIQGHTSRTLTLANLGVNATAAELNVLDLSATALTAGWVYKATGASTAAWGALTATDVGADPSGSAAAVASDLSTHEGLTTGVHGSTSASTASTIVERNGSGDINCRLVRPTFANQSSISGAMAYRVNDSTDNYIRFCSSASAIRTFLGVDAAGTVNYTHPTHPGDDFSVDSGPLTGATVISDIDINVTTDTLGHVTDANGVIATREFGFNDLANKTSGTGNYATTGNWSCADITMTGTLKIGAGVWLSEATHRADLLLVQSQTSTWGGIMIDNTAAETLWCFMADGTTAGIYDDTSNAWMTQWIDGGATKLYYAGNEKLDTTNTGINVTGNITASGTVQHNDTSTLSGTYGSTANGTKIDQITVDDNGHITAITTGATGDILGVTAGTDITGGGTSGTVTINLDPTLTSVTSMYNTSLQVGYSSTTAFIDFNSTAMDFEWSSAPEFRMTSTGNFHADADITAYSSTTTSDRRYKKDIEVIPNALDKINTLNGVTFKWKRDDKKSAGLIAQDVEKVLPQAVCVKEALKTGEEYLALNYDCVVGMLVEAVKELTARVEELENGKH